MGGIGGGAVASHYDIQGEDFGMGCLNQQIVDLAVHRGRRRQSCGRMGAEGGCSEYTYN